MWIIKQKETTRGPLWTVGYFNPSGEFEAIGGSPTLEGAIRVCSALNGGDCPNGLANHLIE